ncbi:MAG: hypothetical protein EBZ60_05490 [Betaproteobacteria bacterium]|nr:hypothetical protein [Betaproteobacteria bacterium]
MSQARPFSSSKRTVLGRRGKRTVSPGNRRASRWGLACSQWASAAAKRTRPVGGMSRIMRCMLNQTSAAIKPSVRIRSNSFNQTACWFCCCDLASGVDHTNPKG